jgi:hypothetical protein
MPSGMGLVAKGGAAAGFAVPQTPATGAEEDARRTSDGSDSIGRGSDDSDGRGRGAAEGTDLISRCRQQGMKMSISAGRALSSKPMQQN